MSLIFWSRISIICKTLTRNVSKSPTLRATVNKFAPFAEARAVADGATRIPDELVPATESVDIDTADKARGEATIYLSSPEKETGKLRDLKNIHFNFFFEFKGILLGFNISRYIWPVATYRDTVDQFWISCRKYFQQLLCV